MASTHQRSQMLSFNVVHSSEIETVVFSGMHSFEIATVVL